jgi:acetyl esterase/lipase
VRTPSQILSELRANRDQIFPKKTDTLLQETVDVSQQEIFIPTRDGSLIRALLYCPKFHSLKNRPVVVIIHGGGFRISNAEMEFPVCIGASRAYGCISFSLEHRLSPEFKLPIAYEDCWDALLWVDILCEASTTDLR